MNPEIYNYLVLPLLICIARIFDVSIGTLRIMFVARGKRFIAPILGFFEILIWILAISQIMANLNNWVCFIAYALGFAIGNFIGMLLEERLAIGMVGVRIITLKSGDNLINCLREDGYSLTYTDAKGRDNDVNIIFITLNRSDLNLLVEKINKYNPKAFYTIEDIRYANLNASYLSKKPRLFRLRKGK